MSRVIPDPVGCLVVAVGVCAVSCTAGIVDSYDGGTGDGQPGDATGGGDPGAGGDGRLPGDAVGDAVGDAAGDSGSPGDPGDECSVAGAAYFVAPGGSDGATGDRDHPFATIQHAVDEAVAGDTVFLRQGSFNELVTMPSSGSPGAPITLRSYCGEVGTIDGTGLGNGVGEPALVKIVGRAHLVVSGLELRGLTGRGGNFPAAIWVRGAATDIVIRDNDVHDISAQNGGGNSGAHGIAVYGTEPSPAERITIAGNTLHDLVLGWSEAMVVNGNVRGFEVRDNTIHDVNNIAFDFIGFEGECSGCSSDDIVVGDSIDRVRAGTVSGNLAFNVSSAGNPAYGSEKSAGCFYVDGGAGIVIERNIAHHCDLGVELASEWFGKSTREITVRNNFIYANDVTGISTGGYSSGTGGGGGSATACVVVNNTIHDSSRDGWADAGILLQNRNVDNIYENNIVVATSGHDAVLVDGSGNAGNLFDFNLYFGGGVSGALGGPNSLTEDPDLVGAAAGDLHILPGSPAENAGADLSTAQVGELDIDGQSRNNGGIDIGADER